MSLLKTVSNNTSADMNISILNYFNDYDIHMALHLQDHGQVAVYSNTRVLPKGTTTTCKIKYEEVSYFLLCSKHLQIGTITPQFREMAELAVIIH